MITLDVMVKKVISTLVFVLSVITLSAQTYSKEPGVIRMMTYNVAYCRGFDGYQDGSKTDKQNTERIGKIIKALDPDVVALQELDSGNINRRFLLEEIQKASGIDYEVIYGMSDLADVGNYGLGILIKKKYPVLQVRKYKLPGTVYGSNPPIKNKDRLMLRIMTDRFYFMCTHLDLNDEQRIISAGIINNELEYMRKPSFLAGDLNDSHRWNGGAFTNCFNDTWDLFSTTEYTISNPNNKNTIDYILYHAYNGESQYSVVSTHAVRGMLQIPNEPTQILVEYASDHVPVILDIRDNKSVGISDLEEDSFFIIQKENSLYVDKCMEGDFSYKIYSISGGCINIGSVNENRQLIPIGQLQKGTYFLTLHATGGHMVYNQKFIK